MIVTADNHIYRRVRSGDKYLGCYFNVITKAMLKLRPDVQKCRGNSELLLKVAHHVNSPISQQLPS